MNEIQIIHCLVVGRASEQRIVTVITLFLPHLKVLIFRSFLTKFGQKSRWKGLKMRCKTVNKLSWWKQETLDRRFLATFSPHLVIQTHVHFYVYFQLLMLNQRKVNVFW